MDIERFIAALEQVAPPELAEEYDAGRIGLVVEGTDDDRQSSALRSTPRRPWWMPPSGPGRICWSSTIRPSGARSRRSGARSSHLLRTILAARHEPLCNAHELRPRGGRCQRRPRGRGSVSPEWSGWPPASSATAPSMPEEIARRLPGGGIRVYGEVGNDPASRRRRGAAGLTPILLREAVEPRGGCLPLG